MRLHSLLGVTASVILALLVSAKPAAAATVTFGGEAVDIHGTGFGNVLQLLTLHGKNKDGTEYGSVLWNGSRDVRDGDATNQSQTLSVAQLSGIGVDSTNFALIFNLAEPGSSPAIDLDDFTVRFMNSKGNKLFDAVFHANQPPNASTIGLLPVNSHGVGTGDYLFNVDFTADQANVFFSNPKNRVGMIIDCDTAITRAGGGPDGFFVAKNPGTLIPEPSSIALVAGLLVLLPSRPRRKRA